MKKHLGICLLSLLLAASSVTGLAEEVSSAARETGDFVTFGHYEQDNNLTNGAEPIEWIVLDTRDEQWLMITRYSLDAKPYNTEYVDITWEECTLRGWLNGEFISTAFSEAEQRAILPTEVDNSAAQGGKGFPTTGGNDTVDQVFLLSYAEADRYFESEMARRCAPTDYALARGAYTGKGIRKEGRAAGLWWLRSPGNFQHRAGAVYSGGNLNFTYANKKGGNVRPVIWVDSRLLPEELPGALPSETE